MSDSIKLILASGSPRRKELLSYLNIPFEIVTSHVSEDFDLSAKPSDIAMDLAKRKAVAVKELMSGPAVILAADTIVILNGEILNKPQNELEAKKMLLKLSGKEHSVITGVSLLLKGVKELPTNKKESFFFCESKVIFEQIDSDLLKDYLKTGESLDKAGAYGIQGASLPFVKEIYGSYSNIVGLPINQVYQKMKILLGNDLKKFFS